MCAAHFSSVQIMNRPPCEVILGCSIVCGRGRWDRWGGGTDGGGGAHPPAG